MRVTYLTGQAPASEDLGPVVIPGTSFPEGAAGQVIGFDANGSAVAITLPDGTLPSGVEGQFVGYGPGGVPIAVDAQEAGAGYDDGPITARVVALEDGFSALPAPYDDSAISGRVTALEDAPASTWGSVTEKPMEFPPSAHTHDIVDVTGLADQLAEKAAAGDVLSAAEIRDLVGAMFQDGTHTNASVTYDEAAGTINITAAGSTGELDPEGVEDLVGGLVTQGSGVSVVYDDANNILTISLSGESYTTTEKNKLAAIASGATANASNADLRDRATHTGAQAISTVTGLQSALDAKAASSHGHAIADVSGLQTALDGKQPTTTFKTVNSQSITGTGNIVTSVTFTTDSAASAYSLANPGVAVFSSQAS